MKFTKVSLTQRSQQVELVLLQAGSYTHLSIYSNDQTLITVDARMTRRALRDKPAATPTAREVSPTCLAVRQASVAADEFVRVNLLVPAPLRKEWKAQALATDRTLTGLIIEAMERLIAESRKPGASKK